MKPDKLTRANTFRFSLYEAIYGMIACAGVGFASVYMLDLGYSNSAIGTTIAAANLLSALLQPVTAAIADRSKKLTLCILVALEAAAGAGLSLWLAYVEGAGFLPAALIAMICMLEMSMAALINALSGRMHGVDYGVGRSFNSICYALLSVSLGALFDIWPLRYLPYVLVGIYLALFFCSLYINRFEELPQKRRDYSPDEDSDRNPIRSGKFWVFLLSNLLLYFCYFLVTNCMIQICRAVGGDTEEMGITLAIGSILEPPAMFFFSKLQKKFSCRSMLIVSGVMIMLKTAVFLSANSIEMLYLAQLLQLGGFGLLYPATVYYVKSICSERHAAKGQAFASVALSAGGISASLLGGRLIDAFSVKAMLLAGVVAAAVGVVFIIIGAERDKQPPVGSACEPVESR